MFPKLIAFLGYDPSKEPAPEGEEIEYLRRRFGLSRKRLARIIACDETTVARLGRIPGDDRIGPDAAGYYRQAL